MNRRRGLDLKAFFFAKIRVVVDPPEREETDIETTPEIWELAAPTDPLGK